MPRKPTVKSTPPPTTAQTLSSLLKSARDIMRKDKGLNGDLDRLPLLTWIMFLKFLDDLELQREQEAKLAGKRFRAAIEAPYRWRDWASNPHGVTGDELLTFINQDECVRPDGQRGLGLFAYLRGLTSANGDERRDVVATVFRGVDNRMKSGYLLRDVVNRVAGLHFTASDELHTLGALYESMLREMRDAAGDSGEFYTPRPVVRFMVDVIDPRLGEIVLDPASGTGGFLVEAYNHLGTQVKTVQDRKFLQERSLLGCEPKSLPYLLCQMNLLLHGLNFPNIDPGNALRFRLTEIGEKDRVDVILTNPPFGGEEEKGIQGNFPDDRQTSETALLFMQLIMRRLKRQASSDGRVARAAVVVPNGVLSSPGAAKRIRADLLANFNLTAVVRLPHNVFAPYTDVKTNILFFDRSGPSTDILYCEPQIPPGVTLSKTKPLQYEWLTPLAEVIARRAASDTSWLVRVDELGADLNLDVKNPRLTLGSIGDADTLECLAASMNQLALEAESIATMASDLTSQVHAAPRRPLGMLTSESDARIGDDYRPDIALIGVSASDGLCAPKTAIGSNPKRYKLLKRGFLAYNPMRLNIGSIGFVRSSSEEGITSPDYVVFVCGQSLLPEFVYHYLRSEPGRHAINQKTKGSVRFRLYYDQLASIEIPCPEDLELQRKFAEACTRLEQVRASLSNCDGTARRCLSAMTRAAFLD